MRLTLIPLLSLSSLTVARHTSPRHATFARDLSLSLSATLDISTGNAAHAEVVSTETGKTVYYDVVVSEGVANPDGGQERMVYLINGEFPAKTLYIDQGDDVEVNVHANTSEATTVHFHGISQQGTPWSDGVPGVSQKLIQPGGNFTYRWTAYQHGLFQGHAHQKQQQDDGLVFPIFIRPSADLERPFSQLAALAGGSDADVADMMAAEANTHVFSIMDWRHRTSEEVNAVWQSANVEPLCVDSVLINGQGAMVCPPMSELQTIADARGFGNITAKGCLAVTSPIVNPEGEGFSEDADMSLIPDDTWDTCNATGADRSLYTLEVDPCNGTWASFGIVNTGGLWELKFSIDEHPLYVYAIDGHYVNTTQPFDIISVPSGVRYQVMVKLDKDDGSAYTIRAAANVVPQVITGYGVLQYTDVPGRANSKENFAAPTEGYPALPQSSAAMDYTGAPIAISDIAEDAATELDPWTDAPPFPASPPLMESDGNITMVVLGMSRPNATTWAANSTGLQGPLYEESDLSSGPQCGSRLRKRCRTALALWLAAPSSTHTA